MVDAILNWIKEPVTAAESPTRVGLSIDGDDSSCDESDSVLASPAPQPFRSRSHSASDSTTPRFLEDTRRGRSATVPWEQINWSHNDSSDEEELAQATSEPSLDSLVPSPNDIDFEQSALVRNAPESMIEFDDIELSNPTSNSAFAPRRRTTPPEDAIVSAEVSGDVLSSSRRRRKGRSLLHCTPYRSLAMLFLIATYTTFWLPYPPPLNEVVVPEAVAAETSGTTQSATLPVEPESNKKSAISNRHASFARRDSHRVTFRKAEVQEFYHQKALQQEPFILSWYVNVAVLSGILVWAAVEQRRRGQGLFDLFV